MSHRASPYRFSSVGSSVVLALAGVIALAPPASAADLDPGYADVPQQQVTFGSGWYIRGDIGATRLPSITINAPSPLPSKSNFNTPPAPTEDVMAGSHPGYVVSVGGGYQFNNYFRADLTADFHQALSAASSSGNGTVFCPTGVSYPNQQGANYGAPQYSNGACTGAYNATLSRYDVLVNGYVDLGNWYSVTPYVGAGVGLALGHYQTSATYTQANSVPYQVTFTDAQYGSFYANYDRQASGTYYNFAWALMGGVAIDVLTHAKLDIGYRYLNIGSIPGASGKLTSQEVRAGIRYMIDN